MKKANKKQKDVFEFEKAINLNVIDEMSNEDLKRLEKVLNKRK